MEEIAMTTEQPEPQTLADIAMDALLTAAILAWGKTDRSEPMTDFLRRKVAAIFAPA